MTDRRFSEKDPHTEPVRAAGGELVYAHCESEADVVEAVEDGGLWGAGLDVFEVEPPRDAPAFESDRIVVSPHHAGNSDRSEQRCIDIGVEKITAALRGEHPGEIVNPGTYGDADELGPERGYWASGEDADFTT